MEKWRVDKFVPGITSWIPYSHFIAKFSGNLSAPCGLECVVNFVGAREPNNKFNIDITPTGICYSYITIWAVWSIMHECVTTSTSTS